VKVKEVALSVLPFPVILYPTDAIVRVTLAGLCGSDMHIYNDREKGIDPGTVMGHEFVGVVHMLGSAVTNLSVGDRVTSPFSICCGDCFFCKHDLPARCLFAATYGWVSKGVGIQGAQAEFIRVPFAGSTLHKIPNDISDEEALFVGDIFATGYFCADNSEIPRLKSKFPKDPIVAAVVGCGPVGLMAIFSALSLGATTVLAIDNVPERLKLAEEFGGIPVNFSVEDPVTRVFRETENRGADCVLEAVGSQSALRTAFKIARPGAVISVAGVQTEEQFSGFTPVQGYDKNITYKNGRCPVKIYMDKLFEIIQKRKVDITKIISHRILMNNDESIKRAYEMFNNKEENCTKVVFLPIQNSHL